MKPCTRLLKKNLSFHEVILLYMMLFVFFFSESFFFSISITKDATAKMNVGVASSNPNPNTDYFNSRGMWVTYILVVFFGHYVLLSIPTITVAWAWTGTHVLHNVVST